MAVVAYSETIPLGLREAYSRLGRPAEAAQFGGIRSDLMAADGTVKVPRASVDPKGLAMNADIVVCAMSPQSEPSEGHQEDLETYVESTVALADTLYRAGDLRGARARYQDAACAIDRAYDDLADDIRYGIASLSKEIELLHAGASSSSRRHLSIFNVGYEDGSKVGLGMVDTFRVPEDAAAPTVEASLDGVNSYFVGQMPTEELFHEYTDPPEVFIDEEGNRIVLAGGWGGYSADGSVKAGVYGARLYIQTQMIFIDLGINALGYRNDVVPPWSFDYLYSLARDACTRAAELENRMLSLVAAQEAMEREELRASQALSMARRQQAVVQAQTDEHLAEAEYRYLEAQLQKKHEKQAALESTYAIAGSTVAAVGTATTAVGTTGAILATGTVTGAAAVNASAAAVAAFVPVGTIVVGVAAAAFATYLAVRHFNQASKAKKIVEQASDLKTKAAATATAQLSAANLAIQQAADQLALLEADQLDSAGYAIVLATTRQLAETHMQFAARLSWLAQRALIHETRKPFSFVPPSVNSYDTTVTVTAVTSATAADKEAQQVMKMTVGTADDFSRAQILASQLESLRGTYVTGSSSARRQEIKWVVPLSLLSPGSLANLRASGACSIPVSQQLLDFAFPGLALHSLKDLRVEFVGTLPPGGPRGVIRTSALSFVRVPNDGSYDDGAPLQDDWVTAELQQRTDSCDDTLTGYEGYVMKGLVTRGQELALSQFDVRSDRAVLQLPAGALTSLQHAALDTTWSIELFRQSNRFDYTAIRDVEFTFWFTAVFDDRLAAAQYDALRRLCDRGLLEGATAASFALTDPDQWAGFVGTPDNVERLDIRLLSFDVKDLPAWEGDRRISNFLVACARLGDADLSVRLLCDADPVGVALTLGEAGAAFSDRGISNAPAGADATLNGWVESVYWSGTAPKAITPLDKRFVLKVAPATIGSDWYKRDGTAEVKTTVGALRATRDSANTLSALATYDSGSAWLDYVLKAKVASPDGAVVRLRLRNATDHYYAEIKRASGGGWAKVFKSTSGTALATTTWNYPTGEFLLVEFGVWDDDGSAHLRLVIDGITIAECEDSSELPAGTVGLELVKPGSGTHTADFDDVEVVSLTKDGLEAETLLSDGLSSSTPSGWTLASPNRGSWAVQAGHNRLDLRNLANMALKVDYRFKMA